jgi:hypothetical protein
VSGRDAGEERGRGDGVGERFVGHFFDGVAEQDDRGVEADVSADLARDELVVARDDLDRHAVSLERADRLARALLGRIEERDVSLKNEIVLVGFPVGRGVAGDRPVGRRVAGGDGEDAEPLGAQALVLLLELLDVGVVHRIEDAVEHEADALREDGFGGALRDDAILSLWGTDHDRHDPPLEIERDLVDLGEIGRTSASVGEHGAVEHALQAGLKVAIRIGMREHRFALA